MSKFEQLINNYTSEMIETSLLVQEADQSFATFLNVLAGGGDKPLITGLTTFNPKNVYYLVGGHKQLETLRKVLVPSTATTTEAYDVPLDSKEDKTGAKHRDIFDATTGEIKDKKNFGIILYNSFDAALSYGKSYISLYELTTGNIGKFHKVEAGQVTPNVSQQKAHESIMKFIKNERLDNIIKYVTPEQATEMEKGGLGKRAISAVGSGIKSAAKGAWNAATQNGIDVQL